MEHKSVKLDKPMFIVSAILALSKTVKKDFHYTYMMKKFKNCKILLSDTDSFGYNITGVENIYEAIKDCELFDFSNYPKDHKITVKITRWYQESSKKKVLMIQ